MNRVLRLKSVNFLACFVFVKKSGGWWGSRNGVINIMIEGCCEAVIPDTGPGTDNFKLNFQIVSAPALSARIAVRTVFFSTESLCMPVLKDRKTEGFSSSLTMEHLQMDENFQKKTFQFFFRFERSSILHLFYFVLHILYVTTNFSPKINLE